MATITGTEGADTITPDLASTGVTGGLPGAGDDLLFGSGGDDSLDGGTGADTLDGGAGDDTYRVERLSDQVIEATGGGRDTVLASGSFVLAPRQEIEVLQLLAQAGIVYGAGNAFANTIIGGAADNVLDGGGGNDSLVGGGGGRDLLIGGDGDDTLAPGEAGAELLGGFGDDTYVLDRLQPGARVGFGDAGGIDMIIVIASAAVSSSIFTLPDDIENLTADGLDAAYGNALDNRIRGGRDIDNLSGLDGDDTLEGGDSSDRLVGGEGNDSLDGGLTGSFGDIMIGGAGNDRYAVDATADKVQEVRGEGRDTVTASIAYTLPDFVEDLILSGTADLAGTGNVLANRITGNASANLLDGAAGDDTLNGGRGDDTLIGGAGADLLIGARGRDVFRFLAPNGPPDTIKAYLGRQDSIEVSAAGFAAGIGDDLVPGTTMAGEGRFTANATGTPEGFLAQFILNTTTGLLRWDADGVNDISAVDLVFLPGAKGLTGAEILVIA